ncbi:DUF4097 family beta strand repeat-containing protein [Streptomyces hiroshimensis]|uniref:DUF4097 domain-containing protein n=1 Tax=Streptomyces hiroshimensis TaxID=66424 RepID=A0ABQ2YMQ6_9ACTN|nr:DUF4097 family beta strand repeat-containing protein [Streptomyces hiroshimensis]GGX87989.1 hypothetical protein GCM10010324_37110 [Streptomyces hiroshimensis]
MPVFETPHPITVSVDLPVGDVRLRAGDRTDTVVEVRPSDPGSAADTKAAEDTRVEYAGGRLLVKGPKPRVFGRAGSVDVTIGLPSDSEVQGTGQMTAFHCSGRLGECRIKTSTGGIHLQESGRLTATTSLGDVTADRVDGTAAITTGTGGVRAGALTGPAVIKNSNGETWVGEASADLRVRSASGSIAVGTAHADLEAKTAHGDIRVGEVVRGSAVLATSSGQIEIGIRPGTAARLDVRTKFGHVHNLLTASDGPGRSDERAEVYATTSVGDVTVRRAGGA